MQPHEKNNLIWIRHLSIGVLLALMLSACVTPQKQSRYIDAVEAPFNDLNLVQAGIPSVLVEAEIAPYLVPTDQSCEALASSIYELDTALGADQTGHASDPTLYQRALDEADNQAVGVIRSTTESILPFRSWVRKLSGADRHAKQMARANAAGLIRRAFLKGVRVSKSCPLVMPQQPYGKNALDHPPHFKRLDNTFL
jgi:hypothetical protein